MGSEPETPEAPGREPRSQGDAQRDDALGDEALCHDAELWWLIHAERALDRQLALGLASLWDDDHFRKLGFARATDFVREHLGIKPSRAYWLATLGRRLHDIPEFDRALAAGTVHASQVVELGRIVSAASPTAERRHWIERAARTSCRALRREVRREIARRRLAEQQEPGTGDDETEILDPAIDPNAEPEGGWMSFPAPARVAVIWALAAELARIVAGRQLSQSQCAEFVFAEYLSALGNETTAETSACERDQRDRELAELLWAMNHPARKLWEPNQPAAAKGGDTPAAKASDASERSTVVDWQLPAENVPAGCMVGDCADAWELAEVLERVCTLKQVIRYDLGGLLERVRERLYWRMLGFGSFEVYCEERLGFKVRRGEQMIRFGRGLDKFALLREAYLGGRVTYMAALKLLPILHVNSEEKWVKWADGATYRELEEVTEYAQMYSLPNASPNVLQQWAQQLREQELARRGPGQDRPHAFGIGEAAAGQEGSNAFSTGNDAGVDGGPRAFGIGNDGGPGAPHAFETAEIPGLPLGYALPPSTPGARPTICGIPKDIAFTDPELCVARIRFWLPTDALELAHRALCRCRLRFPTPANHTWVHFELILVHFIHSHDTPLAREFQRRHKTIARDNFRCVCPICTSRSRLHEHHLELKAKGVCNEPWNLATLCAGHHLPGAHGGVLEVGGWAPDKLVFRLGINPRTGRAFASYVNGRRVSDEVAREALRDWKQWWWKRRRREENQNPIDGEPS